MREIVKSENLPVYDSDILVFDIHVRYSNNKSNNWCTEVWFNRRLFETTKWNSWSDILGKKTKQDDNRFAGLDRFELLYRPDKFKSRKLRLH